SALTYLIRRRRITAARLGTHGANLAMQTDTIQVRRSPDQSEMSSTFDSPSLGRTPPLCVLIIDDSRDCAESMALLLRGRGHQARTAFSPVEAIIAADACSPDVLLMDIGLPGL